MKNGIIGVCLIGSGRAGMIHAENFKSRVPHAKMVAVVDPNREAAESACKELDIRKSYGDYIQALNDSEVDAIIIATPTALHCKIAVAAAKAGKHILCEKPMAMDENECDEMIKSAKENRVNLQIGFMRRFDESFIQAKKQIENGEIGDIVLVKSN
ncbi:MAG: oxidoreductase, partial [Caproiciproducens sp.]|nr:oxidoreductase [Caproiciproducens sp.]